ncbi:MAG TPA: YtxH domain-containing protein [Chloroflexota bacterium]|nr:YtxH domain-containing protein [Chloroflexota bacterium]
MTMASEAVEALGETLREYLPGRRRAPARSSAADALAFSAGLLSGALVAGIAAVFLAPTDGRTLRARLAEKVNELLGYEALPTPATPSSSSTPGGSEASVPPATVAGPGAWAEAPAEVPRPAS